MAEDLCVNLLQVLSWQIPKFHVKHGLFAIFINMAQDFYLPKNKSFTYMKIYYLHFTLVVTLQIAPTIKRIIYYNLFSENQPCYLLSLQYKKEQRTGKKIIDKD